MKKLRSLFAFCALAFTALVSAHADPVGLERDYFHTDNSTSTTTLENSYEVFGYSSGDHFAFTVDYFFATLDIDNVMFEAWFVDEHNDTLASDSSYGGAIEAGEDFSWLDVNLELPSATPGAVWVAVTFTFADNTQLTEWLTAPVY